MPPLRGQGGLLLSRPLGRTRRVMPGLRQSAEAPRLLPAPSQVGAPAADNLSKGSARKISAENKMNSEIQSRFVSVCPKRQPRGGMEGSSDATCSSAQGRRGN